MSEPRSAKIFGCPVTGNSYTESLYKAVEQSGAQVREAIWSGRWLLSELRAGDTLHFHWPSFQYFDPASVVRTYLRLARFLLLVSILRLRGVRIMWTAHNLYPHDGGKTLRSHRIARWFIVHVAERIFVHGPTAAAIVKEEFALPSSRLCPIPHGHWIGAYPDTVDQAQARQHLGVPIEGYLFLFVGLCKPYKGLEALIEAVGAMESPATLLIAGKFPSPDYHRKIMELVGKVGQGRVLVRPGFIDSQDLQYFLRAADTVVLPYREILTSGGAMLALSFGRPVVAPRLGALKDLISSRCGVLFERDDPEGLASALVDARSRRFDEAEILREASAFRWEDSARALIEAHRVPQGASPAGVVGRPSGR